MLELVLLFLMSFVAGGDSASAKKEEPLKRAPAGAASTAGAEEAAGVYKAKCASCHGASGEGSAKIAKMLKLDEAQLALKGAEVQKASDEALLKVLLDGKGKMPSYKGKVSDEEAKKLIQYLRTFKK